MRCWPGQVRFRPHLHRRCACLVYEHIIQCRHNFEKKRRKASLRGTAPESSESGDILRDNVKKETELGKKAEFERLCPSFLESLLSVESHQAKGYMDSGAQGAPRVPECPRVGCILPPSRTILHVPRLVPSELIVDLVKANAKPSPRRGHRPSFDCGEGSLDAGGREGRRSEGIRSKQGQRAFAGRLRGEGLPVGWLSSRPGSGKPEQMIKRFKVNFTRSM